MRARAFRFGGLCLVLAASLLVTCDPFQEDVIPKEKMVTVNKLATEYYILPSSSTVIDLKVIVSSSFTDIGINVSEYPKRGTLTSFGDLIFKYAPSPSFTEDGYGKPDGGKDQFKVGFTSNNRILATQAITVHMTDYTGYFPCSLIAVEDVVYTATGTGVSIKFLFNDRLCGIKVNDVQTSISVNPKHGQVIVKSDSLIYIPEIDFEGLDAIVYKISVSDNLQTPGGNSLLVSYGLVNINVGE